MASSPATRRGSLSQCYHCPQNAFFPKLDACMSRSTVLLFTDLFAYIFLGSVSVSRYVPFLLANAAAFTRDGQPLQKPVMHAVIAGQSWVAPAFPYQVKCLHALRQQYHALGTADRESVDSALSGTGCLDLFVMPSKL